MDTPARVAAEVFLDLLEYADPSRASAPSEARIMEILDRLTTEEAVTFRMDPAGEVLLRADQLAIGVVASMTWLVDELAHATGAPRAAVVGDLRGHIAVA